MPDLVYELNDLASTRDLDRWDTSVGPGRIVFDVRKSKDYHPGELISIIHFLVTAIKQKRFSLIILMDEDQVGTTYKEYSSYFHLLSLLLYDQELSIKLKEDKHLLTADLFEQYVRNIREQDQFFVTEFSNRPDAKIARSDYHRQLFPVRDTNRRRGGFALFIPCFDHLRSHDLHRSNYFYNENSLKDSQDIALWVHRLFKYNNLMLEVSESVNDIATMLKELVQNTHDWARSTFDDSAFILPNIRASYLNLVLNYSAPVRPLSSYDPLQRFLQSVLSGNPNNLLAFGAQSSLFEDARVGICEISVLDSGPGMASRLLEKDVKNVSPEGEVEALVKCFHKYITSEKGGRRQLRGRGLSRVLGLIGRRGFLRVRSGRTLLYRNFYQAPLSTDEISQGQISFLTEAGLPLIEGTSISVLYPFVYFDRN